MMLAAAFTLTLLIAQPCVSRPAAEDSVVSVYTNQSPASSGTRTSGVYLIASNIADKITSPITKFFGFSNKENATTDKRPFHRIELMDDTPEVTKTDVNPAVNEIPRERDVEELSAEGKAKNDSKRPEKITLFTSYLPTNEKVKHNDSINEIGSGDTEPFGFDDDFDGDIDQNLPKPREGGIIYVLEVIGSVIQLLWGGFIALFTPSKTR